MHPISQVAVQEENHTNQQIAELLRRSRKNRRMTVREVVFACRKRGWNTGQTSINRIEKGDGVLGTSKLLLLMKIYQIPRSTLSTF